MAKALTNLAIVQHHNEQYDAAQQNFQAAVEIIEDTEDRLNAQLVNPLRGLAAAQLEAGRPDLASSTFQRAVHVTHVNEGPHNLGQVELLASMAEVNIRLGLLDEANDIRDTVYAINTRHFEQGSLEIVPALMRHAQWQHRIGYIYEEQRTYRQIIRIFETKIGKSDLQLIKPLILLGKSYFYLDASGQQPYRENLASGGIVHFKRAMRIANAHPDSTWQIVTITKLALGDHFMQVGNPQRANQIYRDTWELLSEDEERLDTRRKELERIVVLKMRRLPKYIDNEKSEAAAGSNDSVLQGKISLLYNVSVRGRASDVKLIEADPPEFMAMQKTVHRELRRRVFRPRFFEANPVASPDQIIVHTFFYRQSDLDALRSDSSESASEGG
jgi:tetratricopeptide (TPR) repeat protein